MKKQNTVSTFHFYLFTLYSLCLRVFVAETQLVRRSLGEGGSIKNNKLCKTNPISKKPEMKLTPCLTMAYENKPPLLTMQKQTQSNPIPEKLLAEVYPVSNSNSSMLRE
ncbi:hypothetical protein MUP06_00235, partial [Patescibacteria group bacterium]|nr:hypothetical protein [Patescibacteria group bacterium]